MALELIIEYEFDGLVGTTTVCYSNEHLFERIMEKGGFEDIRAMYARVGASVLHIAKVEKSHIAL